MEIRIDGRVCSCRENETVLDVARRNKIDIPTLCHSDLLGSQSRCRLCIVEVTEGGRTRVEASCACPVREGMEVATDTPQLRRRRGTVLSLLRNMAPENETIQEMCGKYGAPEPSGRFATVDTNGCVLCGLCTTACSKVGTGAISLIHRGVTKKVSTPFGQPSDTCIGCATCARSCPAGAIKLVQEDGVRRIWDREFKLVHCRNCGAVIGTEEEVAYMAKLSGTQPDALCPVCRSEELDEAELEVRYEVDLLIIGGGMAGFCAGLRAQQLGYNNILIIDKASGEGFDWGGSSMVCGGSLLIPVDDSQKAADDYAEAIYAKGQKRGDMKLIRVLADKAWDSYQWLLEQGLPYRAPISVFPKNPEVRTAVADMLVAMPKLRDNYVNNGGMILYNTKAIRLNYDSRGISGAMVKGPDDFYTIVARKTLLCTGGYTANKQFLEDHIGETGGVVMCRSREGATGDGIYMAQAVGGYTVLSTGMKSIHLSAVDPVYKEKGQPGNDIPNMIAINYEGKRFMNEALGSVRHGQAVFQQPVQRDGLIFDAKVRQTVAGTMDKLHKQGVKTWQTDTIEEMAEIFGVDPVVLRATVDEFNAHVNEEKGITEGLEVDKTAKALKIDTPPYYGIYPLVPGTSISFGGLATSVRAEVMQADGQPIPNLYAAGEGVGGFFYDDYFGGTCMTRCAVYGRIAAEEAIASLTRGGADEDIAENQFIGLGAGMGGRLKVKITVEDGVITEAFVDTSKESEGNGRALGPRFEQQILDQGSVDAVAGATVTSNAVIAAFNKARRKAGL